MSANLKMGLRAVVPPLAFLVVVLIVWEAAVRIWQVPALLLPGPLKIAHAFQDHGGRLLGSTLQTAMAALTGFAASLFLGTGIAMLFSQSNWIRRCCFPYAIFLQTVPIIAVAPVIVAWVGEGFWAVVIVATIISLFPVITNVTEGMTSIPLPLQELFALSRASRWQILWKLQFPHALPNLVVGARIAAGSAVLGAIVGEMFAGVAQENPGLGFLIFAAQDRYNMALVFAAIAATTLLGVLLFMTISLVSDHFLLYWRDRRLHDR